MLINILFPLFISFFLVDTIKIITLEPNNFIAIKDTINHESINKNIRDLQLIKNDVMYIYIDSNGGSIDAGEHLINQFNYYRSLNRSIQCIANKAYSMAFHIFQSCDIRYITQSSKLMQHQMSIVISRQNFENILNYMEMLKNMSIKLETITAKRLKLNFNDYHNKIINDWWLYGDDIIVNNAADNYTVIGCSESLYNTKKSITKEEFDLSTFEIKSVTHKIDSCPL